MSRPRQGSGPPPPPGVLEAFGVVARPILLAGGQRRTWRAGDVVLKPVDDPTDQHEWLCDVYDRWPARDVVRVPQPLRTHDGAWAADGWCAHAWLDGVTLRAGEDPAGFRRTVDAFHDVVADLTRPAFLDQRTDPWSFADRVVWEATPPDGPVATLGLMSELLPALEPVTSPPQVIHGDVAGNVLRAPGLPDAVIDWPPYHRPRGFSLAVAAGDAVCWEGAPETLLDDWADVPEWDQLLLRAVIWRIATRARREALGLTAEDGTYAGRRRPSVAMVLRRVARGCGG